MIKEPATLKSPPARTKRKRFLRLGSHSTPVHFASEEITLLELGISPDDFRPAVAGLSETERYTWLLRSSGWKLHEIAAAMNLFSPKGAPREDIINRTIAGVSSKMEFLIELRDNLILQPVNLDKFLDGRHCGRCIGKLPTVGLRPII